ncbi:MAG TPA: hypothetical protein VHF50_03215 [Solirubrobacterales bacterium]|nr:hypothetical protein [Solirubrobacterales bacterium]
MKRIGPEIKMPKLRGSGAKAPQFVQDVYADLRDRRLLPLVALVVVAIVAVPFLLGNAEETAPPPTAGGGAEGVAGLEVTGKPTLTVVQAKPGLRDYRKRLRGRTPNDPFKQKYTSLPPDAKLQSTVESSTTSTTGDSSEVSVTDEGSTVTVEVDEDGAAPGGAPGAGSGGSPGQLPGGRPDPDGGQFYAYRPDLRFGVAGSGGLKTYADLPIASLLPKEDPVLFFIGATEGGDRVVFDVSSEVILVKGEGKCIGGRQSCGLLFIRPGEAVTLLTESVGRTFRLAVDSIDFVPVERPKPAGSSSVGAPEVPGLSAVGQFERGRRGSPTG